MGEPVAGETGTDKAETDLIDAVRAGDPAAMAALYQRHRGQGLKFARSLMSRIEDAEDVLQEAFANAVSAIRNGYGPRDSFAPYLSTCVRSVANTLWKKRSKERLTTYEEFEPHAVEDPALETVLHVFEHEHVAAAMRTLPERWRTVLWHAEVMGARPREIAPLLGIEPNAVSALLIRARAGLRAAFELQTQQTTQPEPALEEAGKR
ncbi:RNA polymerase sigma factor [Arthrobacter rhizosphaerae]|uniref:RNA polymerase sigma factor n=1 Tax=Arthrobacter rhizosphaerae TaxID=2855490 RepID=UPI001FF6B24D|nr:sigma-70 family RNA polymerase sigma factor [Arthrobacter rhizosphaerae]